MSHGVRKEKERERKKNLSVIGICPFQEMNNAVVSRLLVIALPSRKDIQSKCEKTGYSR